MRDIRTHAFKGAVLAGALIFSPPPTNAATCPQPVATLVSAQGTVQMRGAQDTTWRPASLNERYCPGDSVRTQARSRAGLVLTNETLVRLDQLTTLTLSGLEHREESWLDLLSGVAQFISRVPRALKVKTPYVNAAVEGTEFVVAITPTQASVTVVEGKVAAINDQGRVSVPAGHEAVAGAGEAPVARLVAQPRDAVQWALYYAPLIDKNLLASGERSAWAESLQRSAAALEAGDVTGAFAAIDAVPNTTNDARFFNYRAGLLLHVGRLEEARADLSRSLALLADNAHALALQAVIAVATNDKTQALALARRATEREPQSVAAWHASSYAAQAAFDLNAAREALERAAALDPGNALTQARLSELALSQGDSAGAQRTAERAVALNPRLSRTQAVLGFAALARFETGTAQRAFEQAITLDSADPLPRLGLGLAKIRRGALEDGRREIEIAASLDPGNALVRSYLGKAYYEEKRSNLAATQFELAKRLDPNDPTPWFYDAIRKQTENRPVEALQDLQKSIELNDNRAVYRSRLLLDQDLAARSASLARIYSDLGFGQRALVEGWASLGTDSSNYSAHRLLADSYTALPRHEIARASELLQAQMLQPLNLTPIQPQLAETNLAILEGAGPAHTGFGEYNPLFVRNRASIQANGVDGNHETQGNDLVASGLYNRVSASVGTFHYTTDGFRQNNDLHEDLASAFVQMAVAPTLNFQAEVRRMDRTRGDLDLNFDPTNFSTHELETKHQETSRVGLRWAVTPHSDILMSWIDARLETTLVLADPSGPGTNNPVVNDGYQTELLYLFRSTHANLTTGLGVFRVDVDDRTQYDWTSILGSPCPAFPPVTCSESSTYKRVHETAYVYTDLLPGNTLTLTVGASLDSVEERALDRTEINPKLGMQWQVSDAIRLRAAYFETVKRSLIVNQSLEPTQVAGFNQFFDDSNASLTRRSGLGLDAALGATAYGGLEFSHRDVETPQFETNTVTFSNRDEEFHRAYINWVMGMNWTVTTEYQLEKIQSFGAGTQTPPRVDTNAVPVFIRYFSPHGYFAKLGATFVTQDVTPASSSSFAQTHESFTVLDAGVGYRFPRRTGSVSLEARNLTDKQFLYQDLNYASANPVAPRFVPDRTVFGRLSINF